MDPAEAGAEGSSPDESQIGDQASTAAVSQKEDQPPKKTSVRKRTKTGCLTCRRRRIKCDEGKPTCNNCIKSKRQCEGYNQRLTFKEPLGAFHHPPIFGHPVYHQQTPDMSVTSQLSAVHHKSSSSQGPLPAIAPKPPSMGYGGTIPFQYDQVYHAHPASSSSATSPPLSLDSLNRFAPQPEHPHPTFQPLGGSPTTARQHPEVDGFLQVSSAAGSSQRTDVFVRQDSGASDHLQLPASRGYGSVATEADHSGKPVFTTSQDDEYWHTDDEASMADSDDDDDALFQRQTAHLESNDLGIQVARRANAPLDLYGTELRTFTGFLDANSVLATYTPSSTDSPLNDSQTAAIFWYFVNVTGPSMSLYERHPFNPAPMFQGEPVPKIRQHIWTYTFPIISLHHPALLQAILALGSLQMAKLQGIPPTASMKHYHLSLRRISKNYRSPHRRTQAATLAATLLLGFYEIWNSDHAKWCKHMWGARAILREIPLRDMTKSMLDLKWKRRQRLGGAGNTFEPDDFIPGLHHDGAGIADVNCALLSQLTGRPVDYEDYSYVHGGGGHQQSAGWYTKRDVENYENLSDLYWWYCKMDVYQSVLGGTRLFMEYDLWTQCLPRGPIGRIDAVYGTYDHIMLLLGRLANFASLDLARKRQARKEESAGRAQNPANPASPSPPTFPGLLPSKGQFTVPTGFSPPRETTPQSEGSEEVDIEETTARALREWESIGQAFKLFRANLGPDFDPMGPDLVAPHMTPFGPAQTYRTYSIAGIWMSYYMGLILWHRAHPSMPPVAMIAAGMAAQHTGSFANEVGRIAAGLAEDISTMNEVPTSLGAAFIECSFCVFVAAVQYQDSVQRHWTVKRLHDISRLTGWQSARQIAEGCESAWMKAAQLGRGPPYKRDPALKSSVPPSVWSNPRRIDRRILELESDERTSVVLTKSEQAHYALGLLSVEQDLDRLELGEGE